MSDYIDGWDMQDAIGRIADLESELLKERRAYQEIATRHDTLVERFNLLSAENSDLKIRLRSIWSCAKKGIKRDMSERLYDYSDMPGDNNIVCRGSYALGSACGRCQRCLNELESQLASVKRIIRHYESMADNFNDDDIRGIMMLRAASDFRECLTESEVSDE